MATPLVWGEAAKRSAQVHSGANKTAKYCTEESCPLDAQKKSQNAAMQANTVRGGAGAGAGADAKPKAKTKFKLSGQKEDTIKPSAKHSGPGSQTPLESTQRARALENAIKARIEASRQ